MTIDKEEIQKSQNLLPQNLLVKETLLNSKLSSQLIFALIQSHLKLEKIVQSKNQVQELSGLI